VSFNLLLYDAATMSYMVCKKTMYRSADFLCAMLQMDHFSLTSSTVLTMEHLENVHV